MLSQQFVCTDVLLSSGIKIAFKKKKIVFNSKQRPGCSGAYA